MGKGTVSKQVLAGWGLKKQHTLNTPAQVPAVRTQKHIEEKERRQHLTSYLVGTLAPVEKEEDKEEGDEKTGEVFTQSGEIKHSLCERERVCVCVCCV